MRAHECYHCKQWVEAGEAHDCWTTTEEALTRELPEDLLEAWQRLRETAAELGEQRIYASHSSIMFARRVCYVFVRPKSKYLEVCIFLGRAVNAPQIRTVQSSSATKFAHMLRIVHRDEVEAPITDWMAEAYAFAGEPRAPRTTKATTQTKTTTAKTKSHAKKTHATRAKTTAHAKKSRATGAKTTASAKRAKRGTKRS
ncbi:MAG: DUF5655 domain-containing protein [Vicinamibacterales bacterium]